MEVLINECRFDALHPCIMTISADKVYLRSNPHVDFIRKFEGNAIDNAAFYSFEASGDFSFSMRVKVKTKQVYDAAFILARYSETQWVKLALEQSVDGQLNVVSVITNPWSDDANGELIAADTCWLRMSRKGRVWGLHYSLDDTVWRFVRTFGMASNDNVSIGFGVQSPLGDGFDAELSELLFSESPTEDFRSDQ